MLAHSGPKKSLFKNDDCANLNALLKKNLKKLAFRLEIFAVYFDSSD